MSVRCVGGLGGYQVTTEATILKPTGTNPEYIFCLSTYIVAGDRFKSTTFTPFRPVDYDHLIVWNFKMWYIRPSQYRPSKHRLPPNTAAHFKSQIGFLKLILPPNAAVLEYHRFFTSPKNGGIRRDDCIPFFWRHPLFTKPTWCSRSYEGCNYQTPL